MKKFVLFLFLGLFSISGIHAFQYDPVIKEGSFWIMKESYLSGNQICSSYERVQVDGEVVINGITYIKLKVAPLSDGNGNFNCIEPPLFLDPNDYAPITDYYLREDIDEKRLYILSEYNSGTLEEYTVCDFSLEVGEEMVNYYAPLDQMDLTVDIIQTTSDDRKQYIMSDGSAYTEGIGKVEGNSQIYFSTVHGIGYEVACHGNNDDADNCSAILSSGDQRLAQIEIYPNPTSDKITLKNLENNRFKLYSVLGKEMSFHYSETTRKLDISHLRSGIYILEILGTNNAKRVLKVVKN